MENDVVETRLNNLIKKQFSDTHNPTDRVTYSELISDFNSAINDLLDESIGTGKVLLPQVEDDIAGHNNQINTVSNIDDLLLTKKAMKQNPSTWFVYSSGDSLARPLTVRDVNALKFYLGSDKQSSLLTDENKARHDLEAITKTNV